jgi:hypothetical protein
LKWFRLNWKRRSMRISKSIRKMPQLRLNQHLHWLMKGLFWASRWVNFWGSFGTVRSFET